MIVAFQRQAMASKTWRRYELPMSTTFVRVRFALRRCARAAARWPPRAPTKSRQVAFVALFCTWAQASAGGLRVSFWQL